MGKREFIPVPRIADRAERGRLFIQAWAHHITKLVEGEEAERKERDAASQHREKGDEVEGVGDE